jgi:hypothetical protein
MSTDVDGQLSARSPGEETTYDDERILRNEASDACEDLPNEVTYDGECILRNEAKAPCEDLPNEVTIVPVPRQSDHKDQGDREEPGPLGLPPDPADAVDERGGRVEGTTAPVIHQEVDADHRENSEGKKRGPPC